MSMDFDVVVVGGGLAGLTAALTSARLGRSTAILTGGVIGGQLVSIERIEGVPGYPDGVPGYDLLPITQEQADAAGVQALMSPAVSLARDGELWRIASDEGEVSARGVVIATGTALARLGVPGEDAFHGKGVSDCASCDAPLLRGKTAVVVGGGDTGLQETLTLVEHLARVIVLEQGEQLTGQASYRERIEAHPKVEVRFGATVTAIGGEGGVTHVRVKDGGGESELETAAVFPCVGLAPNTGLVQGLVALDATGRIRVDGAMRTEAPGLCAAGNVREGSPHRAAGAMGDGAAAALALERYLRSGEWRGPA